MHNWAIVNRFTAQNFIILQLQIKNGGLLDFFPKRFVSIPLWMKMTLVALTSLKYIFNEEKFTVSFREAAAHLLKLDRSPEGRDFIKQSLSYFLWRWPNKHKDIKMDRPEIVANRGYETFAEHYVNVGIKKCREEDSADIETVLRGEGLSDEKIANIQMKLETLRQSRHSK